MMILQISKCTFISIFSNQGAHKSKNSIYTEYPVDFAFMES